MACSSDFPASNAEFAAATHLRLSSSVQFFATEGGSLSVQGIARSYNTKSPLPNGRSFLHLPDVSLPDPHPLSGNWRIQLWLYYITIHNAFQ